MDDQQGESRGVLAISIIVIAILALGIALQPDQLSLRPVVVMVIAAIAIAVPCFRRPRLPAARIARRS